MVIQCYTLNVRGEIVENKYYLAIELRPNNYFPIQLFDLKIARGLSIHSLEELDAFTLRFTKKEIMDAVREANLLEVNDDMSLVVIYYENKNTRKMEALTKDYNYDMWGLLKENYHNKVFLNKIVNFLNKKIDASLLDRIKNSQREDDFFRSLGELSYLMQRKLYFYLYE